MSVRLVRAALFFIALLSLACPACRPKAEGGKVAFEKGMAAYKGDGVEQNYAEAARWFAQAAEQGHLDATCNLGHLYEDGRGVSKDEKKAAELYQKAADLGSAKAMNNLGV